MNAHDAGTAAAAAACQWCHGTGTYAGPMLGSKYAGPCLVCAAPAASEEDDAFTSDNTSNYDDDVAGRAGSFSRGPNGAA